MRSQTLENLDDGCVRICLKEEALTICTTVSSHHLVDPKVPYLHEALDRMQAEAECEVTQLG